MKIKNIINIVEISLNNYCLLQCQGCPSLSNDHSNKRNLDLKKTISFLENFELDEIILCGNDGEPLEHPEIEDFLLALADKFPETKIHVSSNGELITKKIKSKYLNINPRNIHFEIAIDGPSQNIHELTRKKGNLEKVFEGINFLIKHNINIQTIYSRHRENEKYAQVTYNLLWEKFKTILLFRDTSIQTNIIKSPTQKSTNSDVSVLFKKEESLDFVPNTKFLYIDSNGDIFPCVSLKKYNNKGIIPNINDGETIHNLLRNITQYRSLKCEEYQQLGDRRQCKVNCGIYPHTYQYDEVSDL